MMTMKIILTAVNILLTIVNVALVFNMDRIIDWMYERRYKQKEDE